MPTTIALVRNRHLVEFDKGSFDNWCVYLTRPGLKRYAPRDVEYFSILQYLGTTHSHRKIYNDFVSFYNLTTKHIDSETLRFISVLSDTYGNEAEEVETWFTVLYAGMVAEENKHNTILKKRIKRLGMHQVLVDGLEPSYAATFSTGKRWRELDAVMKNKGF